MTSLRLSWQSLAVPCGTAVAPMRTLGVGVARGAELRLSEVGAKARRSEPSLGARHTQGQLQSS